MSTLADRAKGTAFAILYEPRATPDSAVPVKKTGFNPAAQSAPQGPQLTVLQNVAPAFNTPISTPAQSARTSRIRGRGLL